MRPRSGDARRIPWIPIVVLVGVAAVVGIVVFLVVQAGKTKADRFSHAAALECKLDASGKCTDPSPSLPGQWVNLPEAWKEGDKLAHYGASDGPNTNSHVTHTVDYSKETSANSSTGLPPVGGPHWGSGSCGDDPASAPAYCGPVPWGIYRTAWPAESVVHNMEHGGVVVWYNSSDTTVRANLEKWVGQEGDRGGFVVMTPYAGIPKDTIALTAWSRRDVFPAKDLTEKRVKDFIEKLNCHFNPEGFTCGNM